MTAAVRSTQRYTQSRPCEICGGAGTDRRGSDRRCHGYISGDGLYVYCSHAELAPNLEPQGRSGLFAHKRTGSCRCGTSHGAEQLPLDTAAIERRAAEIAHENAERERLVAAMPAKWDALDRRSIVGENYLRSRALNPELLLAKRSKDKTSPTTAQVRSTGVTAAADIVRFSPRGEPALCERSLETGAVCGIQYRIDGPQKIISEYGSVAAGSALHGRLAELDREGVDVAVLCEGLIDTLTAVLAFPGCAIYGAPGCAHLKTIAAAIAPRVKEIGGWLLVVPDNDDNGVRHAAAAVKAAIAAGLVLDRDLHVVDLGAAHDLNDAWGGGWRWQWPNESGGAA